MLVIVDTEHIGVEPHFASAEGGMSFLLEGDGLDFELSEHVSSRSTGLDGEFGEVLAHLEFLEMEGRFEGHFDNLCFAVWVRCEINDL